MSLYEEISMDHRNLFIKAHRVRYVPGASPFWNLNGFKTAKRECNRKQHSGEGGQKYRKLTNINQTKDMFVFQWHASNLLCKVLMMIRTGGYILSSNMLVVLSLDRCGHYSWCVDNSFVKCLCMVQALSVPNLDLNFVYIKTLWEG